MASRKLFFVKPKYIYPEIESEISQTDDENVFEFDESDIHNLGDHQLQKKSSISISRLRRKPTGGDSDNRKLTKPGSLPVNIPDWSKILKSEYRSHVVPEDDDSDEDDDLEDDDNGDTATIGGRRIIPPHEYLARRRGSSFTVHDGIGGGTAKGRDLRRLRNAIWEKIGFQDYWSNLELSLSLKTFGAIVYLGVVEKRLHSSSFRECSLLIAMDQQLEFAVVLLLLSRTLFSRLIYQRFQYLNSMFFSTNRYVFESVCECQCLKSSSLMTMKMFFVEASQFSCLTEIEAVIPVKSYATFHEVQVFRYHYGIRYVLFLCRKIWDPGRQTSKRKRDLAKEKILSIRIRRWNTTYQQSWDFLTIKEAYLFL